MVASVFPDPDVVELVEVPRVPEGAVELGGGVEDNEAEGADAKVPSSRLLSPPRKFFTFA